MKNLYAVFYAVIVLLCCLSSCGGTSIYKMEKEAKEEALYHSGYDVGYEEGHWDGYDSGYDEGYSYGYEDGLNEVEWKAISYAKENGGWHPEEAWMIIEAYQNNEPFYSDGSMPSEQDYLDAINSLIYFYDYFYSARYK